MATSPSTSNDYQARGNDAFVNGRYDEASKCYEQAFDALEGKGSTFQYEESASKILSQLIECLLKLKRHEDALQRIDQVFGMRAMNQPTDLLHYQKGRALYGKGDYQNAKLLFDQLCTPIDEEYDPKLLPRKNSEYGGRAATWAKMCKKKIVESPSPQQKPPTIHESGAAVTTPNSSTESPKQLPEREKEKEVQLPQPTIPNSPIDPHALSMKKSYEWFQNATHVFIAFKVKCGIQSKSTILISPSTLSVDIATSDGVNFILDDLQLFDAVVKEQSVVDFLPTKVEVKLKKKTEVRWASLEKTGLPTRQPLSKDKGLEAEENIKHRYPSSARQKKDWDKLANEIPDDGKREGLEGMHDFLQDLYHSKTDDDQRRALMKSYYESGGTVLSTNWKDVANRKVECTPPKGMEVHQWNDVYKG